MPFVIAAPLIVAELWFDMRSRSRRLIPELRRPAKRAVVIGLQQMAFGIAVVAVTAVAVLV